MKSLLLKSVPSKVNILVWRLRFKRLATKSNLVKRNIQVQNSYCVFCGHTLECEEHLFINCPLSSLLLAEIKKWWNLNSTCPNTINDLMAWGSTVGLKGRNILAFDTVVFSFCWIVWDYRNNRIFNNKLVSFVFLLNQLKSLSLFWLNVRGKLGKKLVWVNWCGDPLSEVYL